MENNEQNVLDILKQTSTETKKEIFINISKISYFYEDTSITDRMLQMLDLITNHMKKFLESEGNALDIDENEIHYLLNEIRSIIYITNDFLYIKITALELRKFFDLFFSIIYNYLSLNEEQKVYTTYCVAKEEITNLKEVIKDIYDFISMGDSVEILSKITNNLIRKAESILSSAPQAFNLSESFQKVLFGKESDEQCGNEGEQGCFNP